MLRTNHINSLSHLFVPIKCNETRCYADVKRCKVKLTLTGKKSLKCSHTLHLLTNLIPLPSDGEIRNLRDTELHTTNNVLYTICTVYAVSIQKFNFDFDCVVHNGKRNKAQFCHSSSDLRHILFRIYFIFMATWWCNFHYLFQGFASPSPAIWSTEWGAATAR